jgi:predicted dehydrogenase
VGNVDPIGVAVLGAGRWGIHIIRNFLNHPQVNVMAIADSSPERLTVVSQHFNLDPQVVLTTDWTEVLQFSSVRAIAIVTPAQTHSELVRTALKHQLHVLTAKPLALTLSESIELCQLADTHQRQLIVDHTYLFHPVVIQGRSWLHQNQLVPRYGYATRTHLGPIRQDVNALWDLAIHDIAIFNHWLNERPIEVQAQGSTWRYPPFKASNNFPSQSDLVWIKLIYPSGFQAWIHLCWLNPDKQRRLCVVTDQGTLIFDELQDAPLWFQPGIVSHADDRFSTVYGKPEQIPVEVDEPLKRVCDHFIQCIQHNCESPISSGWVGVQLVQILTALSASLNQGGIAIQLNES